MSFKTEVFGRDAFASEAARVIADALEGASSLVLTGGTTAEKIYPALAALPVRWGTLDVFFSDERCVPPDDPSSNYGMAARTLLDAVTPRSVHRMEGERDPVDAALAYDLELRGRREPFGLVVLGLGDDAHVAGLFPHSRALEETRSLCAAVPRPDGMAGLTLTPPALLSGQEIVFVVSGKSKTEAVQRVLRGGEGVPSCPALVFRSHPSVTLLLDEAAAANT